jgi:hypothetical protein
VAKLKAILKHGACACARSSAIVLLLAIVHFKPRLLLDNIRYISSVSASQKKFVYITANQFMLLREIIAVYCENRTEHTDTMRGLSQW